MKEPETITISQSKLDTIKEHVETIEKLIGSIQFHAFHKGFKPISEDATSIIYGLKEINKTLEDK